ncbi:hypothetical protein BHE74_00014990 [Ensete ventricosum]|nr:hypothetical protein GW17_00059035 [Ensete ventricosum]RWW76888.1 hypothetical protein BHE74_00014990 [Ensete ventricosum]
MEMLTFRLSMAACCMALLSHVTVSQRSTVQHRDFISWDDLSVEKHTRTMDAVDGDASRVILVAKDGTGDSTTVQGAVDMIPDGNKERVKILINPGPFISFIGNQSSETVISFHLRASDRYSNGQNVGTFDSATVAVESDYFCANGITFEACTLHAVAESYGAVAASQRNSPLDNSGFSFLECRLNGTGLLYLGRAWGRYARVVYSYCQLEGIILPEGWNDWGDPSRKSTVYFGQFNCNGDGANLQGRVSWARSLTYLEAKPFMDRGYIDGELWLRL